MRVILAALFLFTLAGCDAEQDKLPDDLTQAEGNAAAGNSEMDEQSNAAEEIAPPPAANEAAPTNEVIVDNPEPEYDPEPAPPPAPPVAQPSFDCSKARSQVEQHICDTPALARLDRKVNAAYRRAMAAANPDQAARLRELGREYLADRDRCQDDYCIRQAYEWYRRDIEGVATHPDF